MQSNTPTEVKNSKESTTVELQQLASIDSVTYKVVEKGSTVYILSTKDNLVVKQIRNHSGGLDTMVLLWIGLWIGLISYLMIKD
jgi:LysM repeat protein